MQIEGNNSDEQVVKEKGAYTGICAMQVIAINPSKEELESLGYKPKEEPEYKVTFKNDDDTNRELQKIVFYLHAKVVSEYDEITRLEFLISNDDDISSQKQSLHIISPQVMKNNVYHRYFKDLEAAKEELTTNPKMSWAKADNLRVAKVGEAQLTDFLINWLNATLDSNAKIDNWSKLAVGDIGELKSLFNTYKQSKVKVLLYAKESKGRFYTHVYNRCFGRYTDLVYDNFKRDLEGSNTKIDYQNSFTFQKYIALPDTPDNIEDNTIAIGDKILPF